MVDFRENGGENRAESEGEAVGVADQDEVVVDDAVLSLRRHLAEGTETNAQQHCVPASTE